MSEGKNILGACLGEAADLVGLIDYSSDSIVSKAILDKHVGTITLFAFDRGQKLSEHTSPYDAVVQIIEGKAILTIDSIKQAVCGGQIIVMPANVPHAVDAEDRFKMLLTMIRD